LPSGARRQQIAERRSIGLLERGDGGLHRRRRRPSDRKPRLHTLEGVAFNGTFTNFPMDVDGAGVADARFLASGDHTGHTGFQL
jgi:hypothetical protein